MRQIILGTAGHIDHGKTSLIKALTGVDTDRLKEEKIRGITIELGFASLKLPGDVNIGIIDVPGHEKFVKNMVAGATGIDIVALIIAADEGVMPQTKEHLEICTLLGIEHGLIVMSKVDLVDDELIELAEEDVRDNVEGTFLEEAPVVRVSSTEKTGLDEFAKELNRIVKNIPDRPAAGLFRLPVDRVFSMKGFGTVITGTLVSGKVAVGETVMIYPSRIRSRVRGIQVHNQQAPEASAGMRTAINFQGLEKESISRGDVLSEPDSLIPSYMVDVNLRYLAGNKKSLKNRNRIRFHTGSSEVIGTIALLDRGELSAGDTAPVQIRLDAPVTTVKDDKFVIRSYSPIRTIGGGEIINPIPVKHKRHKIDTARQLAGLIQKDPREVAMYHIFHSGYRCISLNELKIMTNLSEKKILSHLQTFLSEKRIIQVDKDRKTYIHEENFETFKQEVIRILKRFHEKNPLKSGMSKEELRTKFPGETGGKLFTLTLNRLSEEEKIVVEGEYVKLREHTVSLAQDQTTIKEKIRETYEAAGLTPPYFRDLIQELGVDSKQAQDVLNLLIGEGIIVKVKEDLYFPKKDIDALSEKLVRFLKENKEISTPRFKELTGLSRKYMISLLEYFDSIHLTLRIGDIRKLRGKE